MTFRFAGVVKTIQTDDQLCLTAGADGDIRLWDLRLVEDYEERLAAAVEASSRFVGHGQSQEEGEGEGGDDELPDLDSLAKGAGIRREDGERMVEGGPCVKTLEGHSKAVSSLYYEDGCLVRRTLPPGSDIHLTDIYRLDLHAAGHRIFGQDDPSMGRHHWSMCLDDGHSLGPFQRAFFHCQLQLCPRRPVRCVDPRRRLLGSLAPVGRH